MSRNRNRIEKAPLKPRTKETPSSADRTDESVTRPLPQRRPGRTSRFGRPLVGSEVLEALGSNGTVGRAMHDVLHTPDDENVITRLGPDQEASIAFHPDHGLGDAGAEFAEDFGRDFLMAATSGEDIGEIEQASSTDLSEVGGTFLQEVVIGDDLENLTEDAEPVGDDVPPSKAR